MKDLAEYVKLFEHDKLSIKEPIQIKDISIVIPTYNNHIGLNNLLWSILETKNTNNILEIIVVDNLSIPPVKIDDGLLNKGIPITLFICRKKGAASARNMGVEKAKGKWIYFCDDDCIVSENFLSGYINDQNGSIAYCGEILPLENNILSKYYNEKGILKAPVCKYHDLSGLPMYIITANALVYKPIFDLIKFDESFELAAAEDVDFSLNIWKYGFISYSYSSVVYHDFGNFLAFIKRFIRYGKGEKHIEQKWSISKKPKFRKMKKGGIIFFLLSFIQYICSLIGYKNANYK